MKPFLIFAVLLFPFGLCTGQQNLVPNGDFETKISCPNNLGELYKALGWINANVTSPDYFNVCAGNGSVDVPSNGYGYQLARSGQGYAGIYTFNASFYNNREYAEIQLTDTLEAGKKYLVTFWVSLADNFRYACNDIGVYFSQTQISCSNQCFFPYVPQVVNSPNNPLTSKTTWMRVTDTLVALGGELFMTIGNFTDDSIVDTLNVGSGWNASHYYIDDVLVVDIGWVGIDESNLNPIKTNIFPNPVSTSAILSIEGQNLEKAELILYNVLGNKVQVIKNINSNKIVIERNALPPGIYFYSLSENNKLLTTGKLVIQD